MPKPKASAPKKLGFLKSHQLLINKITGLIFVSLAFFVLFFRWSDLLPKPKVEKNPIVISSKLYASKLSENTPVRIIIPKADIDLKVIPSRVIGGFWELSEASASYGLGSGYPGTSSNTVIFAHAREGLFYNLKDVKTGDTVYVFSKNKWFKYKVNKITAVYPNQVEVIKPTKKETLTLYTCTGFDDEKRLVVTAVPSN